MYSSSPPTKTSLVSWWKTFKMRPKDHADLATSPTAQMLAPPGMHQGSVTPGPGMLERPKLPHMSRSNGEWSSYNAATALDEELEESVIFGVPLASSIQYANVSISLTDPNGEQFIYGHIPIVVAKCGVYLKEHATGIEGIFRVSGSAKRMRDLQRLFNTPPRYGKGLDWSGFNVHDAANVLRRYLNHLPEPIVPLEFYEQFRKPLRNSPSILEYIENKSPVQNAGAGGTGAGGGGPADPSGSGDGANPTASTTSVVASEHNASVASLTSLESTTTSMQASTTNLSLDDPLHTEIVQTVAVYQDLIARLPNLNRQLLMYILDLLAVFASKSEENLMPAPNLAAIFQPSILFHPDHDMMPREYRLSRSVIEFMIEHSNKFLSTIETIAREEHARNKELGIKPMAPSPQVSVTSTIAGAEGASGASGAGSSGAGSSGSSSGLMPPGRRHSKSMSSVNAPAAAAAATATPATPVPVVQQPREQLVVRKPRESDKAKEEAAAAAAAAPAATPEKGGLLNTIKRASSLSRRPSQRRTSSNSSQNSELQRSSTINRGYRKSSVKSDESAQGVIPTSAPALAAPATASSMQSPAPSTQINQVPHPEHQQQAAPAASVAGPSSETGFSSASAATTPAGTPAGTPSVATVPNPLAAASPRVLSPSTEPKSFLGVSDEGEQPGRMSRRSSHEKSGSPRFRVLGNVFGHSNDSASSLSGMTRSVSSSSIDGDGVGAEERPKSRWRRSFIFMQPNNSNPAIDDPHFAAPPVRSPGEVSMDDYSMSPSKLSFFKRMRSRERGSQDVERPSSSTDYMEPPAPPSATAVQAAAAAAAAAGGHGHERIPVVKKPVSSPTATSPTATTHSATHTSATSSAQAPASVKKVPVPSQGHVVQGHVVQGQPVQGHASPAAQIQPQVAVPEAHSAQTQSSHSTQAAPASTISASAASASPASTAVASAVQSSQPAQSPTPLQTIQSMIEPQAGESAASSSAAAVQPTPATST